MVNSQVQVDVDLQPTNIFTNCLICWVAYNYSMIRLILVALNVAKKDNARRPCIIICVWARYTIYSALSLHIILTHTH